MKKFMMLVALILCLTVLTLILAGCGEKKEAAKEEPVQEQQMEQPAVEEAPVDTTAVEVPAEQPQ